MQKTKMGYILVYPRLWYSFVAYMLERRVVIAHKAYMYTLVWWYCTNNKTDEMIK